MRIGIDAGGPNTDAVVMDGRTVVGGCKSPTTADISSGSYGRVIFADKIVDLVRETRNGFSFGCMQIDGTGEPAGTVGIQIQNENLIARVDGRVRAIVPDLICVMHTETAEPIPTEQLRYGQRVTVVAASVPAMMRTPEALAVFGPKAFGLDEPFTPIETLEPA